MAYINQQTKQSFAGTSPKIGVNAQAPYLKPQATTLPANQQKPNTGLMGTILGGVNKAIDFVQKPFLGEAGSTTLIAGDPNKAPASWNVTKDNSGNYIDKAGKFTYDAKTGKWNTNTGTTNPVDTSKTPTDVQKGVSDGSSVGNGSSNPPSPVIPPSPVVPPPTGTTTLQSGAQVDANGNLVKNATSYTPPINNTPQGAGAFNTNVQTLTQISQNDPEVVSAYKNLKDVENKWTSSLGLNASHPQTAGSLQGSEGILNAQAQREIQTAQNTYSNALENIKTRMGAAGTAAGLAGQQVSPGTAFVDVTSGKEQYSGLGGLYGLAVANQNIAQGTGFQGQATNLANSLTTLKQTTDKVIPFTQSAGLNAGATTAENDVAWNYWKQSHPADATTYQAAMNEAKAQISGILAAATGENVNAITSQMEGMGIDNLNPVDLDIVLKNIESFGNIRYNNLVQNATGSLSSGTSPYVGATTGSTNLTAGQPVEAGRAAASTALSTGETAVKRIGNFLGSFGLAKSMFGQ